MQSKYIQWVSYRAEWWGYRSFSIRLTDCGVGTILTVLGVLSFASVLARIIPPLSSVATIIGFGLQAATVANSFMRWWCGNDGLVYKYKGYTPFSTPGAMVSLTYMSCD